MVLPNIVSHKKTPFWYHKVCQFGCLLRADISCWRFRGRTLPGNCTKWSSWGKNQNLSANNHLLLNQPKVPAYVLTNTLLRVLGRRRTLAGFMLVGGIACLGIQMLAQSLPFIVPSLALLGKLSLAASFAVVYIHRCINFKTIKFRRTICID